jgi:glutamyl-tRNA synthetase
LNGQYIQEMDPTALAKAVKPFLDAAGLEVNPEALLAVMPPMSKRLRRLPEAIEFLRFLFDDVPFDLTVDQLTHKKMPREAAQRAFTEARELVATIEPYNVETLGPALMALGERVTENGKAGPFLGTARLAITGQQVSPPLFESMVALGRERTLTRLDEVIKLLTIDD